MLYFEAPHILIQWDEVGKIVVVEWRGFFPSDKMRSGAEKVLELIKEKKAAKMLTDTSKSRVVSPEDQNWIVNDWRPRAIKAGIYYMASVVPQDIIAQMAMNRLSTLLKDVETGYFSTVAEAKAWLATK